MCNRLQLIRDEDAHAKMWALAQARGAVASIPARAEAEAKMMEDDPDRLAQIVDRSLTGWRELPRQLKPKFPGEPGGRGLEFRFYTIRQLARGDFVIQWTVRRFFGVRTVPLTGGSALSVIEANNYDPRIRAKAPRGDKFFSHGDKHLRPDHTKNGVVNYALVDMQVVTERYSFVPYERRERPLTEKTLGVRAKEFDEIKDTKKRTKVLLSWLSKYYGQNPSSFKAALGSLILEKLFAIDPSVLEEVKYLLWCLNGRKDTGGQDTGATLLKDQLLINRHVAVLLTKVGIRMRAWKSDTQSMESFVSCALRMIALNIKPRHSERVDWAWKVRFLVQMYNLSKYDGFDASFDQVGAIKKMLETIWITDDKARAYLTRCLEYSRVDPAQLHLNPMSLEVERVFRDALRFLSRVE